MRLRTPKYIPYIHISILILDSIDYSLDQQTYAVLRFKEFKFIQLPSFTKLQQNINRRK